MKNQAEKKERRSNKKNKKQNFIRKNGRFSKTKRD